MTYLDISPTRHVSSIGQRVDTGFAILLEVQLSVDNLDITAACERKTKDRKLLKKRTGLGNSPDLSGI